MGASLLALAFAAVTFAGSARAATVRLEHGWFAAGAWHECLIAGCRTRDSDWGADALTATLALRFEVAHDGSTLAPLRAVLAGLPRYPAPCTVAPCTGWSDVPLWDAIAALQAGRAVGRRAVALQLATAAFARVEGSHAYARGACPEIDYQQPYGGANHLKTLETGANSVRAALLLYAETGRPALLATARRRYAALRRWFREPSGLYTVYVFDDGATCRRLPGRTFASVNGIMIWNGLELSRATRAAHYRAEALATAHAVDADLNDGAGIFADLQAENDVVEPLVEAMLRLAREEGEGFARAWLLRNAAAARGARDPAGDYGRFFDGPPPRGPVTAWQTNGGFALAIAAAALAPNETPPPVARVWSSPGVAFALGTRPLRYTFTGSGVVLFGTLGERCCEFGHARVLIDGVETFDRTGIWQNKSSASRSLPQSVLFAWRWPSRGRHVLTFLPGAFNPKEGGGFLRVATRARDLVCQCLKLRNPHPERETDYASHARVCFRFGRLSARFAGQDGAAQ